jgi:hypothetical protein
MAPRDLVRVCWFAGTLFFIIGGYWLLRSLKVRGKEGWRGGEGGMEGRGGGRIWTGLSFWHDVLTLTHPVFGRTRSWWPSTASSTSLKPRYGGGREGRRDGGKEGRREGGSKIAFLLFNDMGLENRGRILELAC